MTRITLAYAFIGGVLPVICHVLNLDEDLSDMNALVPVTNTEVYRASTDAAALCKGIVVESAVTIQGRKYVKVEGWQAIAIAHGCTGSARDVEAINGGVRAIGEVRRMSDGAVIAEAEGFVGEDEPTWFGGKVGNKTLPKRADYAIRAMAQTRAISRACRSAFAHVVVMMNAGLSTTPAEEVPSGGFDDEPLNVTPQNGAGRPSLAITAAQTAITLCETRAELTAWKTANQAMLESLPSDDANPIIRSFNDRWHALAPEPKGRAAKPAPASNDFGLGADEIPAFN